MKPGFQYIWLLVFQVVLIILFYLFVGYQIVTLETVAASLTLQGYEETHVMIYVGFGFLMTFLVKYCYSALGINWLLAALSAQWAIITHGIFHFMWVVPISLSKKTILEADVMTATVLITFGVVIGRASVNQLLFIAIVEVLIGNFNLFLVETIFQAADVGGSIAIHTYGAFFGIAISAVWGGCCRRRRNAELDHPLETASYMTDVTSLIGSLFLFMYWPSFNAALAGPLDLQRAVVNTYLSLAACAVATFVLSALINHGKFEMEHVQNSTLAGGVGVGTIANYVIRPGSAVLVGVGAAIISVIGYSKLKPLMIRKCGLLDTCGVMHLHGFPGVYSGLLSVIFAAEASKELYGENLETVFTAVAAGRSITIQYLYQLLALVVTILLAVVFGTVTGLITKLKIFGPLTREEQFDDQKFWEISSNA